MEVVLVRSREVNSIYCLGHHHSGRQLVSPVSHKQDASSSRLLFPWLHPLAVTQTRCLPVFRTWNDMGDHRITGPYRANQAFETYPTAVKAIDILANIMVNKTRDFHKLTPADHLLSGVSSAAYSDPPPPLTCCLADRGSQYLVYSDSGQNFQIDLNGNPANVQFSVTWYDAVDEQRVEISQNVSGGAIVTIKPPSNTSHWIGLLQR